MQETIGYTSALFEPGLSFKDCSFQPKEFSSMGLKQIRVLSILIGALVVVFPAVAQKGTDASATMITDENHFKPGGELAFKITLNEPLPDGARFDVRLSAVKTDQELSVSSGEPMNRERTEFTLHTKLPEKAIPGAWHIKVVWLFLPGSSWTNNTLSTNEMKFFVEGPEVKIPTKADAQIVRQ
jgi:hypothetical protein